MDSVPDFFQDESQGSLRFQLDWLEQYLGLGDPFLAKLVGADQVAFSRWRHSSGSLDSEKEKSLRAFWRTVLHLLSFQNFDATRVRVLFKQTAPAQREHSQSAFSPPWAASSLKEYLQDEGPAAMDAVDRWVESFKFGDPYTSCRQPDVCLSTRP